MLEPLRIPADFWHREPVTTALAGQDFKTLFRLLRKYHAATQTKLAAACDINQGRISAIMNGRGQPASYDVINRIATGLDMPDHARTALGLAPLNPRPMPDLPTPPAPASPPIGNRPPASMQDTRAATATRTSTAHTPSARGAKAAPTRQERARRTNLLRPNGLTWDQIAAVWTTDRPDITPRVAFRWAHNLSHQDIADQWNELDPGQPTQTKARIYEYETWPRSGRRPSVGNLDMLARIYQTTARHLLTQDEFSRYDTPSRAEISTIDHRSLDHNQSADPIPTTPAPNHSHQAETSYVDDSTGNALRLTSLGPQHDHDDAEGISERPRTLLAALIRQRNLSYDEAAAELGISARHLARLARRERDTDSTDLQPATRRALHRTFGYPAHDLLKPPHHTSTAVIPVTSNVDGLASGPARTADRTPPTPTTPPEEAQRLSTLDGKAETFGAALSRIRADRGVSLRQLSTLVYIDSGHLSKIENNHRPPTPNLAQAVDDALSANGHLIELATAQRIEHAAKRRAAANTTSGVSTALPDQRDPGVPPSTWDTGLIMLGHAGHPRPAYEAHLNLPSPLPQPLYNIGDPGVTSEDVRRRTLMAWGAAATAAGIVGDGEIARLAGVRAKPQRVGLVTIRHIEAVLHHCRRQEDALGPRAVLQTVSAQQHLVLDILPSAPEAVRDRLLSLLANISRSLGWMLFNLNDFGSANHYFSQARSAAHEAADEEMTSFVLANWSQLATWRGDPREGIEHALGALAWAQRTGSKALTSYAHDVGARAYAAIAHRSDRPRSRDYHTSCMRALDQARQDLSDIDEAGPGKELLHFYDHALHESTRTLCLLDLGETSQALPLAQIPIDTIDRTFVRNRALAHLDLARAHTQDGDGQCIEAAADHIATAAELGLCNTSPRLASAVDQARRELDHWTNTSAVKQLDDRLRATDAPQ